MLPLSNRYTITQCGEILKYHPADNHNEIFFKKDFEGNENSQLFKLNFKPENIQTSAYVTQLTHKPDVNYIFVKQFSQSTNKVALFANHDERAKNSLYHLDINTQALTLIDANDLHFNSFKLNKAGRMAIGTNLNGDSSMSLYKLGAQDWENLLTTLPNEKVSVLGYNEQQQTALLSASIQGRDKQELIELDLNSKKLTTIHKDPLNQSDLSDVILTEDGQPILASYYGARLKNYPLNDATKKTLDEIEQYFGADSDLHVKKIDHRTGYWHLRVTYANKPDEQFVYDSKEQQMVALLNQTPSFDPTQLGDRKSITYTAKDGVEIQGYLTLPQDAQKNLPTIILPHGGPWYRDQWEFSSSYWAPIAHYFATRGYAVLQPNFRGSEGFGKRFTSLGNKNWGTGTMQQDLTDAVEYLVEQGIADKNRVAIMGGSYGGYAALAGATFTPDIYSAVVSYCGPSSISAMVESFPARYRPYLGQFFAAVGDPQIEADRADMEARSPINFVDNVKVPVLLIQGANDPRVPQAQSDMIAKKLFSTDREVEYLLAKDEGHGFTQHNNKLASIIAMENFFAKHLGGAKSTSVERKLSERLAELTVDISKL